MGLKNSINRRINLMMPYGTSRTIEAQYVQLTKDGKYILNYLEKKGNDVTPNFTEIINVNGEWAKFPYHLAYDEYEFEDFDSNLSERIINELPDNMRVKIIINDDKKVVNNLEDNKNKVEISSIGTTEIASKVEQDLYCLLLPNSHNESISKNDYYPYDFMFPIFSLEGKGNHLDVDYEDDVNKGVEFSEIEFSRFGLSVDSRRNITNFLKSQNDVVRIDDIPTLEFEDEEELLRIHFINCPELSIFNNMYKTKSIYIDCDSDDITIKELFSKAFNNEIPYFFETESGTKSNNGVKHNSIVK